LRKCVTTSAYFQLDLWKKVVSGSRAPVTTCIYNCDVPMAVVEERRNIIILFVCLSVCLSVHVSVQITCQYEWTFRHTFLHSGLL